MCCEISHPISAKRSSNLVSKIDPVLGRQRFCGQRLLESEENSKKRQMLEQIGCNVIPAPSLVLGTYQF